MPIPNMLVPFTIFTSSALVKSVGSVRRWSLNLINGLQQIFDYVRFVSGRGISRTEYTHLPKFNKRTELYDVALVFDEGELWYSRQVLCIHSPYLNSRLNPFLSKSRSSTPQAPVDRISIQGVCYTDALCLLRCLTPGECFMLVDMSNILALGRASNALQVAEVTKKCKKLLTEQSSGMVRDGDARLMDLLIIAGQLGYRPILDYLIIKAAETLSFHDIRKRYKELPHMVIAAVYDFKLSKQNRQSHSWNYSPIEPDEYCDCGDDPLDVMYRCTKCKKTCCSRCFKMDRLGARGRCVICSDCNGKIEYYTTPSSRQSPDMVGEKHCMCSLKIFPGMLD